MKETSFLNPAEVLALELLKSFNINIKNLEFLKGHEGETCPYGNIYIGNDKQGQFSEDTYGGGISFDVSSELLDIFNKICTKSGTYPCPFTQVARNLTIDNLIYLLIDFKHYSSICTKNTVFLCKNSRGLQDITFHSAFHSNKENEFISYLENNVDEKFNEFEIINKRFL